MKGAFVIKVLMHREYGELLIAKPITFDVTLHPNGRRTETIDYRIEGENPNCVYCNLTSTNGKFGDRFELIGDL